MHNQLNRVEVGLIGCSFVKQLVWFGARVWAFEPKHRYINRQSRPISSLCRREVLLASHHKLSIARSLARSPDPIDLCIFNEFLMPFSQFACRELLQLFSHLDSAETSVGNFNIIFNYMHRYYILIKKVSIHKFVAKLLSYYYE